ncbi:MAG: phosphotransferase, partial [Pseudomonadales bacterium]|nr:phosphotransferase [Pseudomonadales bacterium]
MPDDMIPLTLSDVDEKWLTDVLRKKELLQQEEVVGVENKVVGEGAGFLGDIVLLYLTYSSKPVRAPASMVLKIPTATDNRHVGQTLGVYEREIRFYRELAPHLDIRTPVHIHSEMELVTDPEETIRMLTWLNRMPLWLIRSALPMLNWVSSRNIYSYVLLIENLEGYRIGDQVEGCSQEEAARVVSTMAAMHAQFWDSPKLDDYPWLISMDLAPRPFHVMFVQAIDAFKAAHRSWLTPRHLTILDWLKENYLTLAGQLSGLPETLIHGDFRLDNLCFDDERGEVIVFDWQTLGRGAGGIDLAYFLSALPDERDVDQLIE